MRHDRACAVLAAVVLGAAGCSESTTGSSPGVAPDGAVALAKPSTALPVKKARGMSGDRMAGVVLRANPTIPQEPSPFRFRDILPGSGVDFRQVSGMTEEKHFPTANGSGCAVLDYDGDGKMDLYFTSCNLIKPGSPQEGRNRLYRNLGGGRFADVTDAAGVGFVGFCHGVIAGDIDNDGDPDLVLCNWGPNRLYLNEGNGTFRDISESSGLAVPGWSSGGAMLDYDLDGDLDIYIANYGEWKYPEDAEKFCGDVEQNVRLYCSPREVRMTPHFLYRNNGDYTFTEVAEEAGVKRQPKDYGHGFGVVAADLNGDGLVDLYVANDMNPNFLFLNKGDGTFEDATETSGAAYDDKGNAQSGMGVDAEDVDGDGRPELFVTNFTNEYNTLYQNLGKGVFYDQTPAFGLAADAMPWVGWGCGLVDLDNDGWCDAFVANGHVDDNRENVPYGEPPLLHRNVPLESGPDASRRFKISTRDVGPYFDSDHVGRGVAFGDLDDDGRLDIVVNHKDDAPAILLNETPSALEPNRWVRLKLVGTRSNRDAIGARVEIRAGGRTIVRHRKGGTSMQSAHDPRMLIGVGPVESIEELVVYWPLGGETRLTDLEVGREHVITEPLGE